MLSTLKSIPAILEEAKERGISTEKVTEILAKARMYARLPSVRNGSGHVQGLSLEEAAILLNIDAEKQPQLFKALTETALWIKRTIYGDRIVLFAPLYTSNLCAEGCLYCGYRAKNRKLERRVLSEEEIIKEVEVLQSEGHRRLLMLCGHHPLYPFEEFLRAVKLVSSVKTKPFGAIRRINVEIHSLTTHQFKALKAVDNIGTYALFQETYHEETYKKMHPHGLKSNYEYRLYTMDRALEAGIDDVGLGALFGLYDYRYEILGLLAHAQYLDQKFRIGPHTISIPRIQSAPHSEVSKSPPYPVSDKDFEKLVAVLRCAIPYTGIILSTRESPEMRRKLYHTGVSQISAGSRNGLGCYSKKTDPNLSQFTLNDVRSTREVVTELFQLGFIPSWCTACYRLNRTGEDFMKIAKSGDIQNLCHPNALLTFAEYLTDSADALMREKGFKIIKKSIDSITNKQVKKMLLKRLTQVKNNARDLFF